MKENEHNFKWCGMFQSQRWAVLLKANERKCKSATLFSFTKLLFFFSKKSNVQLDPNILKPCNLKFRLY